jgi:hypothetical protein
MKLRKTVALASLMIISMLSASTAHANSWASGTVTYLATVAEGSTDVFVVQWNGNDTSPACNHEAYIEQQSKGMLASALSAQMNAHSISMYIDTAAASRTTSGYIPSTCRILTLVTN